MYFASVFYFLPAANPALRLLPLLHMGILLLRIIIITSIHNMFFQKPFDPFFAPTAAVEAPSLYPSAPSSDYLNMTTHSQCLYANGNPDEEGGDIGDDEES